MSDGNLTVAKLCELSAVHVTGSAKTRLDDISQNVKPLNSMGK